MSSFKNESRYDLLAGLFDFPSISFGVLGRELLTQLRDHYPHAAEELQQFLDGVPKVPLDLQELHTRTFDVQSATTLDIGYVLFGDDYKRAELLSHLVYEHKHAKNDCRGELSDHLPNLLRLIPRLENSELRIELVSEILVPALQLMIREFDSERIQKKNVNYKKHYKTLIESAPGGDATIYCRALKALLHVLTADFQIAEVASKLPETNFLGLISKEMEIEMTANPTNSGCDS
jgi:nitrate reductase assembly molybdenum cofactor insertion protein NarJ